MKFPNNGKDPKGVKSNSFSTNKVNVTTIDFAILNRLRTKIDLCLYEENFHQQREEKANWEEYQVITKPQQHRGVEFKVAPH